MFKRVKQFAESIQTNLVLYRNVLRDPECPWLARILLGLAVGYVLLPFDLIPDWIPGIGWLDDLFLVPFLIWLALKLIPAHLIERHNAD